MTMYVGRPPLANSRDLNQGDVIRALIRPKLVVARNLAYVRSQTRVKFPVLAPDLASPKLDADLRTICEIERQDLSLVVSASCDNLHSVGLLLVPVVPFKFNNKAVTAADRWNEINVAATGTASTKIFYLPDSPAFALPRSEGLLTQVFAVSHDYMQRCVGEAGTTRVCGLKEEAIAHLQWALSVTFGRHSREDDDWPSIEDFRLKVAGLDERIAAGGRGMEDMKVEREKALAQLEILSAAEPKTSVVTDKPLPPVQTEESSP